MVLAVSSILDVIVAGNVCVCTVCVWGKKRSLNCVLCIFALVMRIERRRVQRVLHSDARASVRVVGVLAKVRLHRGRCDNDVAARAGDRTARAAAASTSARLAARLQEGRLIERRRDDDTEPAETATARAMVAC